MAMLVIDATPVQLDHRAKTLGDLLDAADRMLAGRRRLVTVLRIDGVEEPAFRDPLVTSRAVEGGTRVEVDSCAPEALAAACLHEAATALEALASAAGEAASAYRMGAVEQGNGALVGITQGVGTALAITGAASLGLGVDVTRVETPHGSLHELTSATSRALDALIAGQTAHDWRAVAHQLNDGLSPVLRRWSAACASIDAAQLA